MKANYFKYILNFKKPSGTSRGILTTKETWFIEISSNEKTGIGECGLLKGLSIDDLPNYEEKLKWTCNHIALGLEKLSTELIEFPSILFGVEMAFKSLESKNPFLLFPSRFTDSNDAIAINGLIWMGDKEFMKDQIQEKLEQGFDCIKMKIGAINFQEELSLIKIIRKNFDKEVIELRVDANGAFSIEKAFEKLKALAQFDIHSIEQPIKPKQWDTMKELCLTSPIPIALDEELIGVFSEKDKIEILEQIKPQYIILKPSLIGGFQSTKEWINLAESRGIGWWITSALESNIGLNAIAQFTYLLNSSLPQGLGTCSLYTNNISSPLKIDKGQLHYDKNLNWNFNIT